jgi:hypothetical protein
VPNAPLTVCFSLAQARETFTSVYERHMKPWPAPMPMRPPVERYAVQDDAQREVTAAERGEWAVLVDSQFRVLRSYGAPPADRVEWKSRAVPGGPVAALAERAAPPAAAEELQGRLKSLFETGFAPNMEMDIPAEGAAGAMRVDVRFVPVRYDMAVRQALVAFRPSVWMPGGKKHFAPNAYLLENGEIVMMEQFSTNRLGYRGAEVAVPKPAGMLRIVCVGGSTTVEGYDDRMTYPAMLQGMLREQFPQAADRIEVVNCGVIGLLSREELEMRDEILALEPDLVIYYNGINDLRLFYKPWVASDDAWPTVADKMRRMLKRSAFMRRFWNAKLVPGDAPFEAMIRENILQNLDELFSAWQARGIPVAVSSFIGPEPEVLSPDDLAYADTQFVPPWFEDMDLRGYTHARGLLNDGFKRLCEEKKFTYLPIAEEQRVGFDQFLDLCHMTPKGIENKAKIMCSHVAPLVAERLSPK